MKQNRKFWTKKSRLYLHILTQLLAKSLFLKKKTEILISINSFIKLKKYI